MASPSKHFELANALPSPCYPLPCPLLPPCYVEPSTSHLRAIYEPSTSHLRAIYEPSTSHLRAYDIRTLSAHYPHAIPTIYHGLCYAYALPMLRLPYISVRSPLDQRLISVTSPSHLPLHQKEGKGALKEDQRNTKGDY